MTVTAEPADTARRENTRATATPWYLAATTLAAVPWLARLRWARATVESLVVVVWLLLPELDFPLGRVAPLLAVTALLNATAAVRLSHGRPAPPWLSALDLALQPLLLTELLELTGGPFNPFAVAYVVPIALAGLTVGTWSGILTAAVSAGGYSLLAYWHLTELVPGHHRLNDFPTHLFTMWLSIALTAELVAYFIVQASNALARREEQLEAVRLQAARAERLVSLTTLAAGAAHELSTPLATIALASRELEHAATARGTVPDLADDARLIRTEVDRCRAILDQMSGRAGGSAVDEPERFGLDALAGDIRGRLSPDRADRLVLDVTPSARQLFLPRSGLTQAILSLITNALDATGTDAPVRVRIDAVGQALTVSVIDRGTGMSSELLRRAGEPFFTTKEPGRGLGLGLFLARVFAERLGGSLTLESAQGTTATLQVPTDVAVSQGVSA
ncbi:MAG: HAMP domain-containing histidine kinase [Acidobacteria bacterium]|nr:HAMP domain-containing histidine kinase [Acidobacteriota bacterium]